MRTKALLGYKFTTVKFAIVIFYLFYMAGTLLGGILSTETSGIVGVSATDGNAAWSVSIMAFAIFMIIASLISAQSGTRFLITRSVSRKEIFLANAVFLIPFAGIMVAIQIISIYIDALVRYFLGTPFRGLEVDVQIRQAPDMSNIVIFFVVSLSILLLAGAVGYLVGSLLARWKIQTVGGLIVLAIGFVALLAVPDFSIDIVNALKYAFTDEKHGLIIALKQIVLTAAVLAAAFPVMRRITAEKQS